MSIRTRLRTYPHHPQRLVHQRLMRVRHQEMYPVRHQRLPCQRRRQRELVNHRPATPQRKGHHRVGPVAQPVVRSMPIISPDAVRGEGPRCRGGEHDAHARASVGAWLLVRVGVRYPVPIRISLLYLDPHAYTAQTRVLLIRKVSSRSGGS
ncbi:uncharacterized protein SCHCODRAFT_01298613 [Schizophyllum commune H4-8]|uniref:uncharacterized protein n=1 Tax=Schizophyllum commune (strain H4-8 / FGSC 9210) TaxID=578458 RepID=UPI00215DE82D|nr:uncharacterized protein SCHCODRAFT_01298613 [Schizophyllum commune H4-8]KAI5892042.1 hypothetical protein SCHCODRAFT_01298613 [Schizophyllum commune H4-8]